MIAEVLHAVPKGRDLRRTLPHGGRSGKRTRPNHCSAFIPTSMRSRLASYQSAQRFNASRLRPSRSSDDDCTASRNESTPIVKSSRKCVPKPSTMLFKIAISTDLAVSNAITRSSMPFFNCGFEYRLPVCCVSRYAAWLEYPRAWRNFSASPRTVCRRVNPCVMGLVSRDGSLVDAAVLGCSLDRTDSASGPLHDTTASPRLRPVRAANARFMCISGILTPRPARFNFDRMNGTAAALLYMPVGTYQTIWSFSRAEDRGSAAMVVAPARWIPGGRATRITRTTFRSRARSMGATARINVFTSRITIFRCGPSGLSVVLP